MTVKVSDLTITEREWPLIIKSYDSDTVHISKVNGESETDHYLITNCNRAMKHPSHANAIYGLKLCPRCGTATDFQTAIDENKRLMAEDSARRQAERDAETMAYYAKVEREIGYLADLANDLDGNGYAVDKIEAHRIFVTFNGQRFEIRNA